MASIQILMVDDQIASLLALEDILSGIDARIIKATSAKEALLVLMKDTIDCVLLDVSMPEMDGFEFLQTLRSAPAHAKIPVIMVTGKIFSENETLKAYQCGAVDFLLKPLDRETVFRKVSFIAQQARRIKSIEHIETHLNRLDKDLVQPLTAMKKDAESEAQQQELSDILKTVKNLHSAWEEISND